MNSYISAHNKAVLQNQKPEIKDCNCEDKSECKFGGECRTPNVAYGVKVTVHSNGNGNASYFKKYWGSTGREVKTRYSEHKNTYSQPPKKYHYAGIEHVRSEEQIAAEIEKKKKKSELAKFIWELKGAGLVEGKDFSIDWYIERSAVNYKNGHLFCDLCLTEATYILIGDPKTTLNKRQEVYHSCRYMPRFKLESFLNKPP